MKLLTAREAQQILLPHYPALAECIAGAVARFFSSIQPEARHDMGGTARASVIHSYMVSSAQRLFSGREDEGVTVIAATNEFFRLVFSDLVVVRFNKLDRYLRPRTNSTQLALEFALQSQQEQLPIFRPPTNVHAGYVLNATESGIERIAVVCPYGRRNAWEIAIPIEDEHAERVVPVEPLVPLPAAATRRLARPKRVPHLQTVLRSADARNTSSGDADSQSGDGGASP